MTPDEYQALAGRTECDQVASLNRVQDGCQSDEYKLLPIRLLHSVVGAVGELGEIASTLERWIYYGQPLDEINIKEELGDALWYFALAMNALDMSMESVMEANIKKLQIRFPDKYGDSMALEENRNRVAEREVLEQE